MTGAGADLHAVAFVGDARLGTIGGQELSAAMNDGGRLTRDRHPLHMHVEDGQKDTDARQWFGGEAQLRRRHRPIDEADLPVGGGHHHTGAVGWHTWWVPEEPGARARKRQPGPANPPVLDAETCQSQPGGDERKTCRMDRGIVERMSSTICGMPESGSEPAGRGRLATGPS